MKIPIAKENKSTLLVTMWIMVFTLLIVLGIMLPRKLDEQHEFMKEFTKAQTDQLSSEMEKSRKEIQRLRWVIQRQDSGLMTPIRR